MNKLFTLTFATACSAALLAQPVLSQSIVVTPEISQEKFVEEVSNDLNNQLERASRWGDPVGEGITIVRFKRAADGEPDNVRLYRRSGKSSLDRTAMRAVRQLDSLDAVPHGVGPEQVYQANIIFASSDLGFKRMKRQLGREEAARIAAGESERNVLAFGYTDTRPDS